MSILDQIPPGPPLADLLALEQVGEGHYRSVGKDRNLMGEVFGGQLIALSVKSAMLSAGGRAPHALHSFFLRGASADKPVDFHTEATRDGRAFAHRRVTAMQDGREVFRAEVSLHDWEEGHPSHAAPAPVMPAPESLKSAHDFIREHVDELDPVGVRRALGRLSFDSAYEDPAYTIMKCTDRPGFNAWVWPKGPPEPGDPVGFYATIAYLTDAFGNFACRASHAPNCYDGTTGSTSLNHAIWFHARPRALDYLLFSMDSPFSGGGLGYNRGTIFSRDGEVLASMVQEALIRYPQASEENA